MFDCAARGGMFNGVRCGVNFSTLNPLNKESNKNQIK